MKRKNPKAPLHQREKNSWKSAMPENDTLSPKKKKKPYDRRRKCWGGAHPPGEDYTPPRNPPKGEEVRVKKTNPPTGKRK